jgi:hypothetical protein
MTAHPLDELREQLVALKVHPDEIWGGPDWNGAIDEAEAILDAFVEAHPGLVDLTVTCARCGAVAAMERQSVLASDFGVPEDWGWHIGVGILCPKCKHEVYP